MFVGLFNPAVTLGLALVGAITWTRAGLNIISEMLAGICAAAVVAALLPGPLAVQTTLGGGTTLARGVCKFCLDLLMLDLADIVKLSRCS